MPTINYDLTGDSSDLVQELGKATSAIKTLDKEADKAAKGGPDKLKVGMGAMEKAAAGMGGKVGETAGRLKNFGEAGSAAATALGPVGLGIAGVSVAVVGMGVALAGAVTAMFKVVAAAGEMNKSLAPFKELQGFEPLAPDALKSIENVNSGMASLGTIFDRVIVTLGAEFAPVLEKVSFTLVKLSLMALDAFQSFAKGKDVLTEVARFMLGQFLDAFTRPIDLIIDSLWLLGKAMAMLTGVENPLQGLSDSWEKLKDSVVDSALGYGLGVATQGFQTLRGATSGYEARAHALIATNVEQAKGLKAVAKALKEVYSAYTDLEKSNQTLLILGREIGSDLDTQKDKVISEANARKATIKETISALESLMDSGKLTASEVGEAEAQLDFARQELLDNEARRQRDLTKIKEEEAAKQAATVEETSEFVRATLTDEQSFKVDLLNQYGSALSQSLGAIGDLATAIGERFDELVAKAQERVDGAKSVRQRLLDEQMAEREALAQHDQKLSKAEQDANSKALLIKQKEDRKAATEAVKLEDDKLTKLTKRQHMAAMASFRLNQAAQLANIAMSTAVGLIALALPPPSGLGPIAGPIFAGSMGALSAATVLAQKPPETRHLGGPIGGVGQAGYAPDEVAVRGKRGEFVVNSAATRGNEAALNQLNKSGSMPSPSVNVFIGTSQIEAELVQLASGDGQFGSLMNPISGRARLPR